MRPRPSWRASGVEIGDELTLEPCDLVFQHELALLEAFELQLIDVHIEREAGDHLIEVAVLDAELAQLLHVAEQIAVDVVFDFRHGLRMARAGPARTFPRTSACAGRSQGPARRYHTLAGCRQP